MNQLSDLDNIDLNIDRFDTDFQAEAMVARLIEAGYDGEKIHILRQGHSRRAFAKDIADVKLHFSEHDISDHLHVKTNREGIYDMLPEGIFHESVHKKHNSDPEDVVKEVRQHRMEEFHARNFFQVFEMETDYALVLAYLRENEYDNKAGKSHYTDIFLPYWPVLKLLPLKQRALFMDAIPQLHRIRGNYDEIAKTMSMLLEVPLKIKEIKLPAKKADHIFESRLGECRLDVDFVLGNTFDDGQYDIQINIGPIPAKKMVDFLETSTGTIILDFLCMLLFSAQTFVVKEFKIYPEDSAFILDHEDTLLGITTYI